MHSNRRLHHSMFGSHFTPTGAVLAILIMFLFLIFVLLFLTLTVQPVQAQSYKVIYNFSSGPSGFHPLTGVTMDAAGILYGTAVWGGVGGCDGIYGCGTVFKLTPAGSAWVFNRIYDFDWSDGAAPISKVVFGPDGRLYGATAGGGNRGGGAVFGLIPGQSLPSAFSSWTQSMLFSFIYGPYGDILMDEQSGHVYGVQIIGGLEYGSIYEVWPTRGRTVYVFQGPPNDGNGPEAGLAFDRYGNLCGTTATGGLTQLGTVFCVTLSGHETILYNFHAGSDGYIPVGVLVIDAAGNIYGTASHGGSGGGGTVFMLSPSGSGWTFHLLYSFSGYGGPGSLTMDAAGNLYGMTGSDGAYSFGNVFKLTHTGEQWIYSSLHDFTFGADGGAPAGNVWIAANGKLYGTASYGGSFGPGCEEYGCGVVWEITQ